MVIVVIVVVVVVVVVIVVFVVFLFLFFFILFRSSVAHPPARTQAASRAHQRGETTAADNSDLSGARAAQAWVWAGVAHTCISNAKTEQGPVR